MYAVVLQHIGRSTHVIPMIHTDTALLLILDIVVSFSTLHLPYPLPRRRWQLLRNPFPMRPNPHEPMRIHLPPYLHQHTSARTHAWHT